MRLAELCSFRHTAQGLVGPDQSSRGVIAIEGVSYALSERFPTIWPILLGLLLLLVILFRPTGIFKGAST